MKRLALLSFVMLLISVTSIMAWPSPRPYHQDIEPEKYTVLDFLIDQEGMELTAYRCSPDPAEHSKWRWAIGIGTPSYPGEHITEQMAKKRAIRHIKKVRRCMDRTILVDLNQNQKVALTSFIYNIGRNAWKKSDVLRHVNREQFSHRAPGAMLDWVHVTDKEGNKRVSKGLVKRRRAEARVFCTPLPGGG